MAVDKRGFCVILVLVTFPFVRDKKYSLGVTDLKSVLFSCGWSIRIICVIELVGKSLEIIHVPVASFLSCC